MADTYRDAQDEIATLRADLATWEAACASAMAENEALRADLAKATKRRVGERDEPCTHDHPGNVAHGKCIKPAGHEVHWNGYGDVWVPDLEALVAERDEALGRIANQSEQIRLGDAQIHGLQRELAQARDERDRYREHSVALNSVGYRAAQALSDAKGEESYVGNPVKQVDALVAERDRLRTAARHAVDLYRQGNVMGTVVAVARLGEVLDGGT